MGPSQPSNLRRTSWFNPKKKMDIIRNTFIILYIFMWLVMRVSTNWMNIL